MEAEFLAALNAEVSSWWTDVRSKSRDYFKAGEFLPLPRQGDKVTAFHSSCQRLYVRRVFDGLFQELLNLLLEIPSSLCLCHLNGNSGVGKSAFLWYFIIRVGIERQDLGFIVYESEAFVWEFRGDEASVTYKSDYPAVRVLTDQVSFHLIDQRVDTTRPIGQRALVAASADDMNTKAARKVRTTVTRYLPAWDRPEYDALVDSWWTRARALAEDSAERKDLVQRLNAAGRVYDWFGGVPRCLLVWDRNRLTEQDFRADIVRCLANNTKLENIRAVLQQDRGNPQSVSWRLFHFTLAPGDFSNFVYTFCSQKVADVYAEYLLLENLEQLGAFIDASEPLPEYGALRGFVFEEYVIGQALRTKLVGMPMVDDVHCHTCLRNHDRGKSGQNINWIQCNFCRRWYHMKCVRVLDVRAPYQCVRCSGRPQPELDVSGGGLLLRYYDGDLEDALIAAGPDAVNYLWRPLKKNNAVFDFVLPPRTLGQITVSERHPSSIDALVKAIKALNGWRDLFDPDTKDKDVLLLYLLPPKTFSRFKFQRYRQSGKVSQRAAAGVVQCKVAVPVNGAVPFVTLNLKPDWMPEVKLNLDEDLEALEACLECKEDDSWSESEFVSLEKEKDRRMLQGHVYDMSEFLLSADFASFGYRRLQSICKQLGIPANTTRQTMLSELDKRVKLLETAAGDDDDMDLD